MDVQASGRRFTAADLEVITHLTVSCRRLSRFELANTICELLEWRRPNGGLKWRECLDLLVKLESLGQVKLPPLQKRQAKARRQPAAAPQVAPAVSEVSLGDVHLVRTHTAAQRRVFRELVAAHHYLGYRVPFGARVQYLAYGSDEQVVACVQFSSAAWRLAARDRWIGWSDQRRAAELVRIVQNSRFLIPPYVRTKNLASRVLALALRRVGADWQELYAVRPLLAETLVDSERYQGTCYRAANWIEVGESAGRGRMDRKHRHHDLAPKRVFVYELVAGAREKLAG